MPAPSPVRAGLVPLLACLLSLGCGSEPEKETPAAPADPCPSVGLDRMAGDWLKAMGARADPKSRFRITGDQATGYTAWLVPANFQHIEMKGKVGEKEVVFDQVLSEGDLEAFGRGEKSKLRLTVVPDKKRCQQNVLLAQVTLEGGQEVERKLTTVYQDFVAFPKDSPIVWSFQPATGPLFLGAAAKDRAAAEAQIKKLGEPDPNHEFGEKIPVGVFTRASDDGAADCTYDMDLYFDDQLMEGKTAVPAGPVSGEWRHWYVPEWRAPYSGGHHFEIHRYRTCGSGKRELIGVNGVEAALS